MTHFILLNGPPRSGKDTAARIIREHLFATGATCTHMKFSAPIKRAFAGMMNAEIDDNFNVEPYESHKEETILSLGVSYRQWQIDFSEKFMKPTYGKEVFAKLLWNEWITTKPSPNYVVISDCGFQVEVDAIVRRSRFATIFRLYRNGCDFSNDSRGYITHPRAIDILNNDYIPDLTTEIYRNLVSECIL